MSIMPEKGVIYSVSGDKFVKEAILSAKSVKKVMPNLKIAIFSDVEDSALELFDYSFPLDSVTRSYEDKITGLINSPFQKSLFLDSDTYAVGDCSYLFDLLDQFEIAAAHDPWRIGPKVANCPPAFPELNTGVIIYEKTPGVQRFLANWLKRHQERRKTEPDIGDQAAFREVLYSSGLRLYCLPPEYNFRTFSTNFAGANAEVKIIHGRHDDYVFLAKLLNYNLDFRAYFPSLLNYFDSDQVRILSKKGRLVQNLINAIFKKCFLIKRRRKLTKWDIQRKSLLNNP